MLRLIELGQAQNFFDELNSYEALRWMPSVMMVTKMSVLSITFRWWWNWTDFNGGLDIANHIIQTWEIKIIFCHQAVRFSNVGQHEDDFYVLIAQKMFVCISSHPNVTLAEDKLFFCFSTTRSIGIVLLCLSCLFLLVGVSLCIYVCKTSVNMQHSGQTQGVVLSVSRIDV